METQRKTLSFLTRSKASAVGGICVRRVAMALLVMLLTTVSALAQNYLLILDPNCEETPNGTMISVPSYNPTYTLAKDVEPTRTGHTFSGWSTSPMGMVEYKTGSTVTLTGDLTLYAVWDLTLTYKITGDGVVISGYEGDKPTGALNIPSTVNIDGKEYLVTSIGIGAFRDCSGLTSVTIPNSVTSIGWSAFYGCCGLTSINIPNSVTIIALGTFYGCSSLTSINIPNSVTSIGMSAFEDCSNLTSITLNSNPKIIVNAFSGTPATVTMNLTASEIGNDHWTTFYNYAYDDYGYDYGYNFQADENTTVYKGTVDNSTLVLTEVEDKIVNKETAVILKSSGNPVMTLTKSNSSDTNGNDLRGISDRKSLNDVKLYNGADAIYTLGNTTAGFGFHRYTGEYVPAGKAFLPLNTSNGAKPILTMVFANETTGINSLSSDDTALQNDWFSLDGTRLNGKPSQHGIYINGNKKVVVK